MNGPSVNSLEVVNSIIGKYGDEIDTILASDTGDPDPTPVPEPTPEPTPTPAPDPSPAPGQDPEPAPSVPEPTPEQEPPTPPGGPLFTDPEPTPDPNEPTVTLADGTVLSLSQIEALAAVPPTPPAPTFPFPPVTPPPTLPPATPPAATASLDLTPTLPPFTEEDLDNPAIKAVVLVAAAQQRELAELRQQMTAYQSSVTQAANDKAAEIANSARSAFQQEFNLPDDLMTKIETQAAMFLQPELDRQRATGSLNPYEAVKNALINGYWVVPEARSFEFERQAAHRQQSLSRQRKLNGVGGTGGANPRVATPFDLSTEDGRRQAAIAEAAAAMGVDE